MVVVVVGAALCQYYSEKPFSLSVCSSNFLDKRSSRVVSAVIIHTLDVGLMQSDSCAFALFQNSSKLNLPIGEICFIAPLLAKKKNLELLIGLRKIFKTFGKVYSQ